MSGVEGDALVEAGAINASLSALGDVLNALSKHHKQLQKHSSSAAGATAQPTPTSSHGHGHGHGGSSTATTHSSTPSAAATFIPFRNSKLTHLLKDSLGGSCKTLMVATVRQSEVFYGQSLSTLRYASRARDIKNKPRVHGEGARLLCSSNNNGSGSGSGNGNGNTTVDDDDSSSKLAQAYSEITSLRSQLALTVVEFDRTKAAGPQGRLRSPEAKIKLRDMQARHSRDVARLEARLSSVVQSSSSLLSSEASARALSLELGEVKLTSKAEEASHRKELEESRYKLDEGAKKTLRKLAKERKVLKERNKDLEETVGRMRREEEKRVERDKAKAIADANADANANADAKAKAFAAKENENENESSSSSSSSSSKSPAGRLTKTAPAQAQAAAPVPPPPPPSTPTPNLLAQRLLVDDLQVELASLRDGLAR